MNEDDKMQAPSGSGALLLQEYRREVPPGWCPRGANYSLLHVEVETIGYTKENTRSLGPW